MIRTTRFLILAASVLTLALGPCHPGGFAEEKSPKKKEILKAPAFPKKAEWVNGDSGGNTIFSGKLTLVYFWDYTTINNIRELGQIRQWYEAYKPFGFNVIFVHTPEFPFGYEKKHVEKAIQKLDIPYPVVLDNGGELWEKYGNRSWPTKHLVDSDSKIIHTQAGEGLYVATELAIRENLLALNSDASIPGFVIREDLDRFNIWECGDMSTELYVGFKRAAWWGVEIANRSGVFPNQILSYRDRGKRLERGFFLHGRWGNREHYFEYMDQKKEYEDYLGFIYVGREVYGVLSSVEKEDGVRVYVQRDEAPIPEEKRGEDVQVDEAGKTFIHVQEPRLYYLVREEDDNYHELRLYAKDKGFASYVFSFSNTCLTDFKHL